MKDTITISPRRKLGPIFIDCTIEEAHSDELAITEHPVEQGAAIADHAYRRPASLVFRIGFSNSSRQAGGDESYVTTKYAEILALQQSREPFSVITGKRSYSNMLIAGLAVTTDEKTEAVLIAVVTCREVIIVQTQTTSVPPTADHAEPEKTAAVQDRGSVQPRPAALSPSEDDGAPEDTGNG